MFDTLIRNGLLVDGTGKAPFRGTLALRDAKIAAILPPDAAAEAAEVWDARGLAVAPGFLDIHTHSDTIYRTLPTMNAKLVSGVTCEIVGNCGGSCVPVREDKRQDGVPYDVESYARDFEQRGATINIGTLIGHGTLRAATIGWEMRQMTPEELERMQDLLERMLLQGAVGVSFGLIYPPGSFCDTEEIMALARVCKKHDRTLSVHMRNENRGAFDALAEMIRVGEATGVRVEISHFKLMGKAQWGRAGELLAMVDEARARGVDIHCDQYPYTASSSALTSCFPKWAMEGGFDRLVERLRDDAEWARIREGDFPEMYQRGGPENIIIRAVPAGCDRGMLGKSVSEIAEELGCSVTDALREILIRNKGRVSCFYHSIGEADMLQILARRDISIVSDGNTFDLDHYEDLPHPRSTATAPRFLRLVREHNLMPLEAAVYKLTGLPASVMRLDGQLGLLKEGLWADITVFDPATVADHATYQQPALRPTGIERVWVGGQCVLDRGTITEARPGRFVRPQA